MKLDWKSTGDGAYRAGAEDDCYCVYLQHVAFECGVDGAYEGGWSTDTCDTRAEALSQLLRAVEQGEVAFEGEPELYRVGQGLDAAYDRRGRGVAVSGDWYADAPDGDGLGYYAECGGAIAACEEHAGRTGWKGGL